MYPLWITNLFFKNPCVECRKDVTIDDIVAIGVCRPEPYEAHLREANAVIRARCKHCDHVQNYITRFPKPLMGEAIEALIEEIENAPTAKPLLGPGSVAPENTRDKPTKNEKPPGQSAKVRPSIRVNQKTGPITDAEVKAMLKALNRLSLKTNSETFKKLTDQ